ncbi:MAG: hypothetical protein IPO66_16375 [Rhodanobacteraceae bacterium]|nr:hypothetical protein [Rhodanobacteraceae bacterium]
MPVTALRFHRVLTVGGRPDMAPLLFARAIEGRPIQVFKSTADGDFTHVDDIVAGVLGALDHAPAATGATPYQVYNLGRGEPVDLMRFIELSEIAAGRLALREYREMQSGDMLETFADVSAARAAFGYAPSTSIEAGVPPLVEWCRQYSWPS